ncbi:MAG: glycosyltransferase family 2 protein [Anaerolineae bacterium]|nr:glycosyltransferase family 2 protein [Anaerolineae bacterium]
MPYFLQHLLPWVDEIVVVDDGSTDGTPDLARAAGPQVRVICAPRQPGEFYSDQRNKGIAAATSDWLLHMDADERVTPELAAEILVAIRNPALDGYRFRRLNHFLQRPIYGSGWHAWNLVHLARREQFRFGGQIHETCLLDAPPERIGQLTGLMWHLNERTFLDRIKKNLYYSQVAAADLFASGHRVTWFDLLVRPFLNFLKGYVIRRGFRDGIPGLIINLHNLCATFRVYAMVWDRQHPIARETLEAQLTQRWADHAAGTTDEPSPNEQANYAEQSS